MKHSILFVDDEINLIQGLKRSLRSISAEYDLFFALSGPEALDILAANQVELIITDIRMPIMDGGELLEIVREKYPQVIRFVLSGSTDQESSLRASRIAHQFITKPCETNRLIEIVNHSLNLRALQSNPRQRKVITSINKLPSLPSLYIQLVNEINLPEPNIKKISDTIANDITMTAKTLQLVNSAFYGLPSKISNLQHAVSVLGINTLRSIVLFQGVFSEYEKGAGSPISLEKLWFHSIGVGNLARHLARKVGCDARTMDDAQVAGVMHDIGKLIQINIPGFYSQLRLKVSEGFLPLNAEFSLIGTSHAELGAYLLGIWGLPDSIVQAVAFHHVPSLQIESAFSPLSAVHIANAYLNEIKEPKQEVTSLSLDLRYIESIKTVNTVGSWLDLCREFSAIA